MKSWFLNLLNIDDIDGTAAKLRRWNHWKFVEAIWQTRASWCWPSCMICECFGWIRTLSWQTSAFWRARVWNTWSHWICRRPKSPSQLWPTSHRYRSFSCLTPNLTDKPLCYQCSSKTLSEFEENFLNLGMSTPLHKIEDGLKGPFVADFGVGRAAATRASCIFVKLVEQRGSSHHVCTWIAGTGDIHCEEYPVQVWTCGESQIAVASVADIRVLSIWKQILTILIAYWPSAGIQDLQRTRFLSHTFTSHSIKSSEMRLKGKSCSSLHFSGIASCKVFAHIFGALVLHKQ